MPRKSRREQELKRLIKEQKRDYYATHSYAEAIAAYRKPKPTSQDK